VERRPTSTKGSFGAAERSFGVAEETLGPIYDPEDPSERSPPAYSFGTSGRPDYTSKGEAPGPGVYHVRDHAGHHRAAPAYSMASGSTCRHDVAPPHSAEEPGPGQYPVTFGFQVADPRKCEAPKTKFGRDTNRTSFLALPPDTPGPGQYKVASSSRPKSAPGPRCTFGARASTKVHIGPMHTADCKGADSPGPGHYLVKGEEKVHAWRQGTGPRSKLHAGNDAPGPGQYKVDKGVKPGTANKFRNGPASSFSRARREGLAKLRF